LAVIGGQSVDNAIQSSNGALVYWGLQETSGAVAAAWNRAVALGRDVLLDNNPMVDTANWIKGTGWTIAAGVASCDGSQTGNTDLQQSGILTVGKTYEFRITITNYSAGVVQNVGGVGGTARSANGTYTEQLVANSQNYRLRGDVNFIGDVNVDYIQQTDIAASSSYPGPELLSTAGDGTADKDNYFGISAVLTNPSTNLLRVTGTGAGNPYARQLAFLTAGRRYLDRGEVRSNGFSTPEVAEDPYTSLWVGTTSTSWQPFNFEYIATGTGIRLYGDKIATTEYSEFRNLSVKEANPLNGDHTGVQVGVAGNGRGIRYAARYDGGTTYTDIYSAELNSMFNPSKGTLIAWAKVSGAGVWTDGNNRFIVRLAADSANNIEIRKSNTNNQLRIDYDAGGISKVVGVSTSILDMFMIALTWDVTADEMKVYLNGEQQGVTQTGLGTWVGNLLATETVIGAASVTPTLIWDGDIAYVSLYDEVLTQSEITNQYRAGN
jgi:hypothetical protein